MSPSPTPLSHHATLPRSGFNHGLLEEQVLVDHPLLDIEPRSVATALTLEGHRFLSLALGDSVRILQFGSEGLPVLRERFLFVDDFPEPLGGDEGKIVGHIQLRQETEGTVAFDNVRVFSGEQLLFADDFAAGMPEGWTTVSRDVILKDGWAIHEGRGGFLGGGNVPGALARKTDESWQDFGLESDLVLSQSAPSLPEAGIQIGGDASFGLERSFFALTLSSLTQQAILEWRFFSAKSPRSGKFTEPFRVEEGITYRLGLESVAGQVQASVQSPVPLGLVQEGFGWTSLTSVESGLLALTAGNQPYSIDQEGETVPSSSSFNTPISETRIWREEGSTFEGIGICLPRDNQILITFKARFALAVQWPSFERSKNLIANVGREEGEFFFPLSFDVGPDGRIFVLDAGNARIQVFDGEGNYLTQWGRKGTAEGEFDFGSGLVPEDFAGSVAVDGEGFIYVADVGNRRIQKFAP